jgi:hypothetical protein
VRKTIKAVMSAIVFLFGWAWWLLDLAGRGFAFWDLKELFPSLVEFLSKHQELAYQIAPWVLMIVPICFFDAPSMAVAIAFLA